MRIGPIAVAFCAIAASAVAEPSVIRFVPQADPGVLDPVVNSSYISMEHGYMVYDTLLAMDEHFVAQPEMLDRYSVSDDGRTYSFVLRDGLRFTDGSPVRATDAVASIKRWAARDTNGRRDGSRHGPAGHRRENLFADSARAMGFGNRFVG
jgi:peptide/nickel transport system substrate-binding protein